MRNHLGSKDPVHLNMLSIFATLFEDFLTEYIYTASLAGLDIDIDVTNYGLNINFSGYNEKMDIFLDNIFHELINFQVNSERFACIKETVRDEFKQS